MTMAMRARSEFPQPRPNLSYRPDTKSGNPKPAKDRKTVAAANALAAHCVYVSMMYACVHYQMLISTYTISHLRSCDILPEIQT